MPEITATVVAKSPHGIKIEQDGPWWNWSKPEYRGEPFNTAVKAGDRVHMTYAEKEYQDAETGQPYTTAFISTIEVVTQAPPKSDSPSAPSAPVDTGYRTPDQMQRAKALTEAVLLVSGVAVKVGNVQDAVGQVIYAYSQFLDALNDEMGRETEQSPGPDEVPFE